MEFFDCELFGKYEKRCLELYQVAVSDPERLKFKLTMNFFHKDQIVHKLHEDMVLFQTCSQKSVVNYHKDSLEFVLIPD